MSTAARTIFAYTTETKEIKEDKYDTLSWPFLKVPTTVKQRVAAKAAGSGNTLFLNVKKKISDI